VQHLDPLSGERIDRDGVVGRGIGDVDRADAVGQHAHALALEAAQHRPRRARAERGGRNARQPRQRVADLRADVADQPFAGQHRGAGQDVQIAQEVGRHDDVLRLLLMEVIAGAASLRGGGGVRGRRPLLG
jgi:hypothetical protein